MISLDNSHPTLPLRLPGQLVFGLVAMALALLVAGCGDDKNTDSDLADSTDAVDGADATDATDSTDVADMPVDSDVGGDARDMVGACSLQRSDSDPAVAVDKEVATLGTFPNTITIDGTLALVVNSGDNAVQSYDTTDPGNTGQASLIDVGNDQNPYDLAVFGDRVYITNSLGNSLTIAATDGTVIDSIALPEFASPQDIVATSDYLFVANTEFTFPAPTTRFGSVLVLSRSDTPTLLNRIETTQSNPQYLAIRDDVLLVANSGATNYDVDTGLVTPTGDGGLDVFPLAGIEMAMGPASNTPIPPMGMVGNPSLMAVVNGDVYLGSGTAPVLFKVATDGTLERGAGDPILLFDAAGANALTAPFAGPRGALYVLDFNNDGVWIVDPSCDQTLGERIDLGTSTEMLEGPFHLAWDQNDVAHVLLTVSSAVTTFDPQSWLR